jgi:hypothetical protein
MRYKWFLSVVGVSLCCVLFGLSLRAAYTHRGHGPTVSVAVHATDTSGGTLHYQWKSTDGTIQNVNAPSTTWTLPEGPGLHFAYVLVSNGLGGFTERRIAVNTDTIGTRLESENEYARVVAPKGPAQTGDYYRLFETLTDTQTPGDPISHGVYSPDLVAHAVDPNTNIRYPAIGEAKSDHQGGVTIPGIPANVTPIVSCSWDNSGTFVDCSSGLPSLGPATTDYVGTSPYENFGPISGSLKLDDGGPCGTLNEFFGVFASPTATLLDSSNAPIGNPVHLDEFGSYALPYSANAASVLLQCDGAPQITVPIVGLTTGGVDLGETRVTGVTPPTIPNSGGMTATWRGKPLAPPVAIFLPPPSGFPSDIMPRPDGYLAVKGLDSRLSACLYYKSVGAVKACDSQGNFAGAITFKDWRHAVRIGEFAVNNTPTYTATYINKVDLNLARVQESITYGPNRTAGVVCNHLGPPGGTPDQLLNPTQADVDAAVDNAVANKNLVACVAMDYTISSGVNGNKPFIRFLIFGPSGDLLPSINLDGRREKFVPGTCVVCHGGDHYAGKVPEDGSGFANVGAHFLPYDVGNFEFSSKPGLTKADQQLALYNLNQNVLNTGPTVAEQELIAGWYAGGTSLDENYLPPSWSSAVEPNAADYYRKVLARSCRTCHVAMIENYNFDHYDNIGTLTTNAVFPDVGFDVGINICGGSHSIRRDHMMPNSLITFNRLWLSADPSVNTHGEPNQIDIAGQFYGTDFANIDYGCPLPGGTKP